MKNTNKILAQQCIFNFEIRSEIFPALNEITCKTTNKIISKTGNSLARIISRVPSILKSKKTYFCIAQSICSKSFIQNAIKVKNTRYCVTKILVTLPIFDLKNLFDETVGNFYLKIV